MLPSSLQRLQENIAQAVIGKEEVLNLMLIGLLTEGHILIEDVPGVGKTLMAKSLAASINAEFHRIQCTPDLTPTDVTGFNVFDRHQNNFTFRPGPVLTNILLIDEINRAVPRTQSSLLEAMEEKQITVDGETIKLPQPFLVIATQNPIELEGTFPLPEAQLDRFLLKFTMGYPSVQEEERIIQTYGNDNPLKTLKVVADKEEVMKWQDLCRGIFVHQSISSYIVSLVRATRSHPAVVLGASPRASLALHRAVRALAMLRGREYVIPDDVKYMAKFVLPHRLSLKREERLKGVTADEVLAAVLTEVSVPVEESRD